MPYQQHNFSDFIFKPVAQPRHFNAVLAEGDLRNNELWGLKRVADWWCRIPRSDSMSDASTMTGTIVLAYRLNR